MIEGLGENNFLSQWTVSDQLLEDFSSFAGDDVEISQEEWKKDLDWIRGSLKRELGRAIFSRELALRVDLQEDKVVREASALFEEAERIHMLPHLQKIAE